jgi:hypothetical protein
MIVRRPDSSPEDLRVQKRIAREAIKSVREALDRCLSAGESASMLLESVLTDAGITLDMYERAINLTSEEEKLILRRQPSETYINNYCPAVLKYWRANMDLSYVVNAYACIVYITSYMMKDERNLSELLMEAAKEASDCSVREQLRKVGSCFLTHREVSAQEAVYRLLSLRLKESTCTVVFVNAGPPESRVSVLRPTEEIASRDDEDEDIYQLSLIDRYIVRPKVLEGMSLAEFAATYVPRRMSDQQPNDIRLIDDKGRCIGCMKKRKKMAVIRYPRFKEGDETFFR